MKIDIKKASEKYFSELKKILDSSLTYSEGIVFKELPLDFINNKALPADVGKLTNVIYVISIDNIDEVEGKTICKIITQFKEEKNQKIKFPRVNSIDSEKEQTVLYIGKSKGKLKDRFRSHFSNSSPGTYALHLEYWQNHPELKKLKLRLHYAEVDLKDEDINSDILEILETAMHKNYSPLLGRTGH